MLSGMAGLYFCQLPPLTPFQEPLLQLFTNHVILFHPHIYSQHKAQRHDKTCANWIISRGNSRHGRTGSSCANASLGHGSELSLSSV